MERKAEEKDLIVTLGKAKGHLAEVDGHLQSLHEQLDGYSDQKIAQRRFLENEKLKIERLDLIEADKRHHISNKQALLEELESRQKANGGEIETKMLEMKAEEEGKRDSGKKGRGPFWGKLAGELQILKREAASLEQQIGDTRAEITDFRADKTDESKVNEEFKEPRSSEVSKTVLLTREERAGKARLQNEVTAFTSRQRDNRRQVEELEAKLGRLNAKFDLSTRDDTLTQTDTLLEIAMESPVLFVKILSLFFLIFFIDTAPVFIKLTAKTGHDEYLKSLDRQKIIISTQELDEYHGAVIASAKKRNDLLMDYEKHIGERINNNEGDRSKYAEDFRLKINEVLVRRTDDMLWKIEEAEGK